MHSFHKSIGTTNLVFISITLLVFIASLVTKGWTHDLFLEAAIFLVSVKLIIGLYQLKTVLTKIDKKIDKLNDLH